MKGFEMVRSLLVFQNNTALYRCQSQSCFRTLCVQKRFSTSFFFVHCKCFDHKNYGDWKLQGPCRDPAISSKILVIRGGVHLLRHCQPFSIKNILLTKGRTYFFSVQKYCPPFVSKIFLLTKGGTYFFFSIKILSTFQ